MMDLSKIMKEYSRRSSTNVYVSSFDSPIGKIISAADDCHLFFVTFEDAKNFEKRFQSISHEVSCNFIEEKNKIIQKFEDELKSYFMGNLKKFTVPLKTFGSDFQKEVWNCLLELPYGSTQTYGDLAKELGRDPSHARAVGAACGANAHIIVIPCHRLVASGGKGGFSSGVDRKKWLLQHEQKHS